MALKIKAREARSVEPRSIGRRLTLPVGAFSVVLLGAMPALLPPQLTSGTIPTPPDLMTVAAIGATSVAKVASSSPLEITRPSIAPGVDGDAGDARKNPFIGEWRGVGWLAGSNGVREQLNCRATHTERGQGERALHVLRCGNEHFQIDLTSNLRQRNGRISGSWREASHNLRGGVSGAWNGDRLNLFMRSDNVAASLHATVKGCNQSIGIRITEMQERQGHVSLKKVGC
ncbi:MAG: hypothetical protein WD207_07455 [Xanthobacteraceae bacterium]